MMSDIETWVMVGCQCPEGMCLHCNKELRGILYKRAHDPGGMGRTYREVLAVQGGAPNVGNSFHTPGTLFAKQPPFKKGCGCGGHKV